MRATADWSASSSDNSWAALTNCRKKEYTLVNKILGKRRINDKMSIRILGTGSYLPETIVTNDDLAKVMDTSDEWIRQQNWNPGTSYFCGRYNIRYGSESCERSPEGKRSRPPEELDCIFFATLSGDRATPNGACDVQKAIGAKNAVCMDLNAACSGFVYALTTAIAYAKAGMAKKMLVIGVETLSKIVDWSDRSSCVLFGDGAGCAVVEADDSREVFIDYGSNENSVKH